MTRYKLIVEYDGTNLSGWQRQENAPSVQQHLEEALLALSQEKATIFAAGRTDAGVHALGQLCHFDLEKEMPADNIRDGLNHHVKPQRISVVEAEITTPKFHSRFDAKARSYIYRILNRKAPPALAENRVWHVPQPLDIDTMRAGAKHLIGKHDFTSFRASECQANSPEKTLSNIVVEQEGEEIHIVVTAPSFLHHMVRNIVGTLKLVGTGKWAPEQVKQALEAKDRSQAGPTAPAEGLYFLNVLY